jgi:hypothetical protein
MNPLRIAGLLLIVAGVAGFAFGGFSYTKDETALKVGPIEVTAEQKKSVDVPLWASVGAIVVGGALLLLGGRSR